MEKKSATPSGFTGRQLMATILIACGVLLLGRNLGIFPNRIFHIIVSWPMLLVGELILSCADRHLRAWFCSLSDFVSFCRDSDGCRGGRRM